MAFGNTFDGYCVIHASFLAPARRSSFERELKSVSVDKYEVVDAEPVDHNDSRLDFYPPVEYIKNKLSLIDALKKCINLAEKKQWRNVLIFEDDVIFRKQFLSWWDEIEFNVGQFNWDVLYFYRWHNELLKEPQGKTFLLPIEYTLCNHCFSIKATAYSVYQDALDFSVRNGKFADSREMREYLRKHGYKIMATSKNLAGQAGSQKSIITGEMRYFSLAQKFSIQDKNLVRMLAAKSIIFATKEVAKIKKII